MWKNKPIKFVLKYHRELRRMWVGIIVYDENPLTPQIGPLVTDIGFQLANLAIVH